MAEPFTIYKLTILSMLDKVDFPLSNTQLTNFFLEQDYTDYFRVQQVISDLSDAELVRAEPTHNNTNYYITAAGKETLNLLRDKIPAAIETDIMNYFYNNHLELRDDNSIIADYYRTPNRDFAVRCQYRQKDINLIDLTLSVQTREQAEAICNNWKKQNEDVYAYLMDILMK